MWFGLAGLLSVRSVSEKAGATIEVGEGVVLGLVSGGLAGLLSGIMYGGLLAVLGPQILETLRGVSLPADSRAQLETLLGNPLMAFAQNFCMDVVLGPTLGCLGGLLGTQVFKKS